MIELVHAECSARYCFDDECPYTHHDSWFYNGEHYNTKEAAIAARNIDQPDLYPEDSQ